MFAPVVRSLRVLPLLLLAASAFAGDNPDVRAFVLFENDSNYIEPMIYETFTATIYLENFGPGGGTEGVAFQLDRTFEADLLGITPRNGGLIIGDEASGYYVAWLDCQMPDVDGRVAVADLSFFYYNTSGVLRLLPHPSSDSSAVVDCSSGPYDYWCVRNEPSGNGGVWATPPAGNCGLSPREWNVPGDAPTIQAGIDSASAGDTVTVAAGTYHEYDIQMKSGVYLRGGTGDPADVIVDADSLGRVMRGNDLDSTTVIEAITFTRGYEGEGAGAGLYLSGGAPTVRTCVFTANSAAGNDGGGIAAYQAAPTIRACVFFDNDCFGDGGGLWAGSGDLVVVDCGFEANWAVGGGAIAVGGGNALVESCQVHGNVASSIGGGIYLAPETEATVRHCVVDSNVCSSLGGGFGLNQQLVADISHCLVVRNRAYIYGGGVYGLGGETFLAGCTLAGNDAPEGSGIYAEAAGIDVTRSILAFNETGAAVGTAISGAAYLSCSDVFGNEGGDWTGAIASQDSVNGNFHADPLFCDALNPSAGYALQGASPCANDTCGLIGADSVGCAFVKQWFGGGDGVSWEDPDNWDPYGVPGPDDDVYIDNAGSFSVDIGSRQTVGRLTVGGPGSSPWVSIVDDTLTLLHGGGNGGTIEIDAQGALEIPVGETFTNEGGGELALLDARLTGGGFLVNGGYLVKPLDLKSRSTCVVSVAVDNRLDDPGDGAIEVQDGILVFEEPVTNSGDFLVRDGAVAMLDPGDGPFRADVWVNSGVLTVESGGTLLINNPISVLRNLLGGEIRLQGTGLIDGTGAIQNFGLFVKEDPMKGSRAIGTLSVDFDNLHDDPGDGAVRVNDGVLLVEEAFANAGSCFVNSAAAMMLDPGDGPIRNDFATNTNYFFIDDGGSLTIAGATTVFRNSFGGLFELIGSGEIVGEGALHNYGTFAKNDPMKSRAVGHVAVDFDNQTDDPGDGAVIVNDGVLWLEDGFTNAGSCIVHLGAEMLLDPGDGPFTGGDHEATRGRTPGVATNLVGGDWLVMGTLTVDTLAELTNAGEVRIDSGGWIANLGSFDHLVNGVLSGRGTFDNTSGTFTGAGVIRPGASTGLLTFLGDFTQTPTAELEVEIGGLAAGAEYDRLVITGNATFDGAVYVDLVNGFTPVPGDSFAVILLTGGPGPRTEFDCFSGLDVSDSVYLDPYEDMDLFALVAKGGNLGNARPVAGADLDSTNTATTIVIHPLGNDTDADDDPLRIAMLRTPSTHGFASIGPDDTTIVFTPSPAFIGRDSLVYTVTDCRGGVDSAWVAVGIARAPRAWLVPGDAPTIRAGIDSALARDTVVVAAGVHHEPYLTMKSGVVLRGATGDPADVTVDADSLSRAIYCYDLGGGTAVIGITFTGGIQVNGGGAYVSESDMFFDRCVFTGNRATSNGGGVRIHGSDVLLRRCDFTGNIAAAAGGGLGITSSTAVLESCLVGENLAGNAGGGLHAYDTDPVLANCTIADNESPATGAAMYITSGTATIDRSVIAGNQGGVAILCSGTGFIDLSCSDVYGNSGGDYAGCLAGQLGVDFNFSSNPLFCRGNAPGDPYAIDGASSCAPAQQPSCGLVGARGVGCDVTGVAEEAPPSPPSHRLYANRPNPFNPTTTIRFDLPREERVTLFVYDVTGRRVAILADGRFGPGAFERVWRGVDDSGRSVASGVYFARLAAGEFTAVRKMVLLR